LTTTNTKTKECTKSRDQFRLIYDVKGRFVLHRISDDEKKFKLCRIKRQELTGKKIPGILKKGNDNIKILCAIPGVVKGAIESVKNLATTIQNIIFFKCFN
jgi:ribosomal protein S4E